MIVVTAQRGGSFRESMVMAKAYVEARRQHGESELLDEIVAAKPERDHTRYRRMPRLGGATADWEVRAWRCPRAGPRSRGP
jgi:hypothetical protein